MGDDEQAERLQKERADLEARARAGEWLKTGDVAKLLGFGRTKVHLLLTNKQIGYRKVPGATQKPPRICNPVDVLRLLDESRREYPSEGAGEASE